MVEAALDRSEPSPRLASNGIHTKSGADNLQGKGLKNGPGASQDPIRRGSQKPGLSSSRTLSLEMREYQVFFSHELPFSLKRSSF